jgi:hypothetical protein
MNSFSLGAQTGGPDSRSEANAQEQQLRNMFNQWKGNYSDDIREFAFILRIDGSIHVYTEMWGIYGAQKAKRKRDWIEVEIGIPKEWWAEAVTGKYKLWLTGEIERGFVSIIDALRAKKRDIKAEKLLGDWNKIKSDFLSTETPPSDTFDLDKTPLKQLLYNKKIP